MEFDNEFKSKLADAIQIVTADRINNPVEGPLMRPKKSIKAGARLQYWIIICENPHCRARTKKSTASARFCDDRCRKSFNRSYHAALSFLSDHQLEIARFLDYVVRKP